MKINDFFISKDNLDKTEKYFSKIVKMGLKFKTSSRLIKRKTADELKKEFLTDIPQEPTDLKELYKQLEEITSLSTNFSSKKFMAFPDAGNAISSVAAALLVPLINQNLINEDHCSPVGTFVEIAAVNWLRSILGYSTNKNPQSIMDVGGIITSGGTISNTIALMAARDKLFPKAKEYGVNYYNDKVKLFVPKYISHYSQRCSMAWLGLGEKNIVEIEVTDELQLDLNDLKAKIDFYKKDHKIMAIVCYAGDSRAMALDNFEKIAEIAHKNNIWFHVDACHGFQFGFSDKLKKQIKGIELADSITMDPHKVLAIPYVISALAFKNPADFAYIASNSDLIMKEEFAFGQITPMLGSRAFNSLKLWSMIKGLGRKNIGELVEKRHNLAVALFDKLKNDDDFIVINKRVGINSVMFMYNPFKGKKLRDIDVDLLNTINRRIYKEMFDENCFYLHSFPFPDIRGLFGDDRKSLYPLRYMSGNALADNDDLDEMIKTVKKFGRRIAKEYV